MVLSSAGLAAYYGSQMRWISGTFALANAVLLLYGIRHFIGFAEMKQDLGLNVSEPIWRYMKLWFSQIMKGDVPVKISSSLAWKPTCPPQPLRAQFFSWPVLWSMVATLAILWPALASGGIINMLNPIQVENRKRGTADWILTRPARHHEIEGYASHTSVNRGDTLQFFVKTDSEFYTVRFFRKSYGYELKRTL